MKKIKILTIALAVMLSMTSCSSDDSSEVVLGDVTTTKAENVQAEVKNEETPVEDAADEETGAEVVEPTEDEFEYKYDADLKGVILIRYKGDATAIRIPKEIDGDPVVMVGDNDIYSKSVFSSNITDIELHDGITNICFRKCGKLENITIPSSVTIVDNFAFAECESLKSIVIPSGVTAINYSAFFKCKSLENVTIPNSVTKIEREAFADCTSLVSVTIPDSVTEIEHHAFSGCTSLESITIPDSVVTLDTGAFSYCTALKEVNISKNITILEDETFNECTSLKEITLPDGLEEIKQKVFLNCTKLRSMTLPDNIKSIYRNAFFGCEGLTVTYKGKEYTETSSNSWSDLRDDIESN